MAKEPTAAMNITLFVMLIVPPELRLGEGNLRVKILIRSLSINPSAS
jgi:hypothetical protein